MATFRAHDVNAGAPAPLVSDAAIDRLYSAADAGRWRLGRERFAVVVRAVVATLAPDGGAAAETACERLHAADLALALACADGHDAAWDHFVQTYRPELYRAARAMTDPSTGRELADSLYAELYGLTERDGERRSLFRYYHGRAKLSTWLRSVLAQRHVDLVRGTTRLTSIDDAEHPVELPAIDTAALDPGRRAVMRHAALAVTAALEVLAGDARVRLAYYYTHGLTLAQIGRVFGESEATASRKLERARTTLRSGIAVALADSGLRVEDVDDWAEVAREAWDAALEDVLAAPPPEPQDSPPPPFKGKRTP